MPPAVSNQCLTQNEYVGSSLQVGTSTTFCYNSRDIYIDYFIDFIIVISIFVCITKIIKDA